MAKKEIRVIVATGDVAGLIDHGSDVDSQIKNLTYEDKGIKTKISESVTDQIQKGETSVRLKGNLAAAVVSAVEKVEIDASKESFPVVRKAIDAGVLEGVVERRLSLVVPPADVEKASQALKKAGILASVTESLSVTPEAMKQEATSVEQSTAMKALEGCVNRDVSYRVKYEKV